MFKKSTKILTIIGVIVAIATAWFFYGEKSEYKTSKISDSSPLIFNEEKSGEMDYVPMATPSSTSAQTKKYENTQYGFSFNYPAGFTVSEFTEEEGRISLIIQNEETKQAVQFFITPYNDNSFEVSSERIKRDIPDLPFSNSADVVVGGKANGAAFFSENEAFKGQTAEVWFADGKIFFQATASAKDARLLEEIVKSWRFK